MKNFNLESMIGIQSPEQVIEEIERKKIQFGLVDLCQHNYHKAADLSKNFNEKQLMYIVKRYGCFYRPEMDTIFMLGFYHPPGEKTMVTAFIEFMNFEQVFQKENDPFFNFIIIEDQC